MRVISVYFRLNVCANGPIRLLTDHDFTVRCIQVELIARSRWMVPLNSSYKIWGALSFLCRYLSTTTITMTLSAAVTISNRGASTPAVIAAAVMASVAVAVLSVSWQEHVQSHVSTGVTFGTAVREVLKSL